MPLRRMRPDSKLFCAIFSRIRAGFRNDHSRNFPRRRERERKAEGRRETDGQIGGNRERGYAGPAMAKSKGREIWLARTVKGRKFPSLRGLSWPRLYASLDTLAPSLTEELGRAERNRATVLFGSLGFVDCLTISTVSIPRGGVSQYAAL